MGIISTAVATGQLGPTSEPRVAQKRLTDHWLDGFTIDPAVNTDYTTAVDEVQTIAQQLAAGAGDTFTLTFDIPRVSGGKFTTAAIAYDATAATIETAIDVAATAAALFGWTNGDITVADSGTKGVSDGTVTLTFDGASVTENPVVLGVLTATGFTKTGVLARTAKGQTNRYAGQLINDLGIASVTYYYSGEAVTLTRPRLKKSPRLALVIDLARQAAADDGNNLIWDALRAVYPQMPAAESR